MKKTKTWLVALLAVSFAIALYSVFESHSKKRPTSLDDNWEQYWNEYERSVELALDALLARHDGRTNDFESLLALGLFDESLRKAILFYDNNGNQSEANRTLKAYIYLCVVNHAADPRPPGSTPYDTKTIDLFRKIAAIQPTVSNILVEPEIEAQVAQYIEQAIHEYEAFANQTSTNEPITEKCK